MVSPILQIPPAPEGAGLVQRGCITRTDLGINSPVPDFTAT